MIPVTNGSETLHAMSELMTRFAKGDGPWATAIPRLSFIRYSTPHQPMPAHYPPCFCLITQGSKSIAFGDDRLVYDAARFVVAAVDLPVTGVVLDATPEKPYLCVMLEIDTPELASLLLDAETPAHADAATRRGLFVGDATGPFVDAVWRLMRLLDTPEDIRALAPLAEREVLYRLLQSNAGERLREVLAGNGPARRIAAFDRMAAHALPRATARRAPGRIGAHEPFVVPRAFQASHRDEPDEISEAVAAAGSSPPVDDPCGRCRQRGAPRWLSGVRNQTWTDHATTFASAR